MGALVSGLLKGLDVLANPYALVGIGLLVMAAVASLPTVATTFGRTQPLMAARRKPNVGGQRSARGRLEAHEKRGNELLARIDQAMAKGYTGSLAPDSTFQLEIQRLGGDMVRWTATAEAWVKELAPHLLDEFHTDYGPGEPVDRSSAAGVFYEMWEPLRQRVDALQRVIDAMEDW